MTTVIGESLEDTISDPRRPGEVQAHAGGSPLNLAVGVARLVWRPTLYRTTPMIHMGT